jgi:excisionase family DNA binding protein
MIRIPKTSAKSEPVTFLTIKEAAEMLRVCPKSVEAYIKKGRLRAVKLLRTYRIPVTEIERLQQGDAR